ncbi:MAG TPA: flagellin [Opitutaceae bacterium]|nr:flagellin [Opitutaceae bacterium]
MRVTNSMVTGSIVAQLQQLETQQSTLQAEVSSGLAVTQPSDNPSAFGQVIQEQALSSQIAQYTANANQALNLAQSSYAGLNSLTSVYDRATQLATLGSGSLGASANSAYADELNQLIEQAVSTANSQFNGNYIYAGTAVNTAPFTTATDANGNITAVTYAGNSAQTSVPVSATSSVAPGTTGATNAGLATMINDMIAVRDAMNSGSASALSAAQTSLANDENTLSDAVAQNGAVQLRIQSEQTQQQSGATELSQLISNQTNADLPSTLTKLSQAQLAYQAALETASKVMQLSLVDYIH